MENETFLREMENFFMALADKTRLRLLNLMRDDEICVCFFTEVLGESQPKISRHLAYLRNANLVGARREGKWMHYRIIQPKNEITANILRETLDSLKTHEDMQKDYKNLVNCCGISMPLKIEKLNQSNIYANKDINNQSEELETFLL